MAIKFTCPACGTSYPVADAVAGRNLKCRGCGTVQMAYAPVPVIVANVEKPQPDFASFAPSEIVVRVSARKLTWPLTCPCCGDPADSELNIDATRWKGVRVIRSETKTWIAPYCQKCIRHAETAQAARVAYQEAKAAAESAITWLIGSAVLLTLAWIAGLVVLVQQGASVGWAVLWTLGYGASTGLAAWMLWQRHISATTRKDVARGEWDKTAAARNPSCRCLAEPAVVYDGWYGNLHTFIFRNKDYAEAFIVANREKVLG